MSDAIETTYIIGSNMPGYMPDSEPYTLTGTFEEALACLLGDLEVADQNVAYCMHSDNDDAPCGDEDCSECAEAREVAEAIAEVKLWDGPDSVSVGNYVYWITAN